jgi:hypothetical protein
MSAVLDFFSAVSDPLKIAWVLWIGWGIAQVGWYRRSRQQEAQLRAAAAASALQARTSGAMRRSSIQKLPAQATNETVRLSPPDRDRNL